MSSNVITARSAQPTAGGLRRDGLLCGVGGSVAATGAAITAVVSGSVHHSLVRYPFSVGAFRATEVLWTVTHVLTLLGVLALVRSGFTGSSRLARIGNPLAVLGMTVIVPAELGFAFLAHSLDDSSEVNALGSVIGVAATLAGLGLLLSGIAVLRANIWTGWGRWTPVVAGAFVPLVLIPVQGIWPDGFLWPIAGWSACLAALGLAIASTQRA